MANDSDIGWSLGVVFRAWQRDTESAVGDLPHGPRGFQILSTLAAEEPPTHAALAAHLAIDRTVLTYVIDDLVEAGLVERKPDAADRRVRRLVLTASGARRLVTLRERVAAVEATLFPGLSAEESGAFRALLARAAAGLHSGSENHDACTIVSDILGAAAAPRIAS